MTCDIHLLRSGAGSGTGFENSKAAQKEAALAMAVTNNNFAMSGEKYDVKHFPMVPFIDAPVWPPIAFIETYEEEVRAKTQNFDAQ